MDKRNYNKLFVHKNRKEGSEKILLGYKYNAKDLILEKDKETTFHVPYFVTPQTLTEASLIQDGATAGPFPAAADRILKNRKNYENITPNGSPSDAADGVWFCSWLYKDEKGNVSWVDRYFNPGKITYEDAVVGTESLTQNFIYEPNNPVFRDVSSTMVLDPGVMYKYYHAGEKTFKELVSSFGGVSGEHLRLNLSNWQEGENIDTSNVPNTVVVNSTDDAIKIFGTTNDSALVEKKTLKYSTAGDTEAFIFYDKSYCITNEFTWSFWAQSDNWQSSQYTQLVGNYSSQGGVGVFVDTLSSFPFFVFPETQYGHLLFINEDGEVFLDKSTQTSVGLSSQPAFISMNKDNHVIVCEKDFVGTLYKVDNAGKILANKNGFFTPNRDEETQQVICGPDDSVLVLTNKARYTFDKHLNLIQTIQSVPAPNTIAAYKYNIENDTYSLNIKSGVLDLKYIEEQEWFISALDSNLYRNSMLFAIFKDRATSFAIDPYNRIWVLHGLGDISVFDTQKESLTDPLFTFGFQNEIQQKQQNIYFYCHYNRSKQTREWRAIIFYSENTQFFIVDMEGNLIKKVDKYTLFNPSTISFLKENPSIFKFVFSGDITGYEHRRVFHNLSPFRNTPQLVIKAALKDTKKTDLIFYHQNSYSPLNLDPDTFQHFCLNLRGNDITLYINSKKATNINYSGRYSLSYELQPSFYIGVMQGSKQNLNKEIKKTSLIFNGQIADIKIYDYSIPESYIEIFLRESLIAEDMSWSLPSPATQYIEKIERLFQNKLPGFKTPFFKIKLANTGIADNTTKNIVEEQIKILLKDITPTNVELVKIEWVD